MTANADREGRQPGRVGHKELAWIAALGLSGAFVLAYELESVHHAARTVGGRITGAVFLWLILAAFVRLIIHLVALFGRLEARSLRPSRAAPSGQVREARRDGDQSPTPGNRSRTAWPHPTACARGWTVRYAVLALIASQVVLFVAAIFLGGAHVHVPRGAGGLITEGAFLVVLIPLWRSGRLHPVDLGLRRAPAAASVGLAVLSLIAVSFLQSWWIRAANVPRAHSAIVSVSHRTIVVIVLAGITACVAAPVIEEVFFRGFLYRSLRNRLPILPAALIVGVIFGLAHTQYPLLERPNQMIFGVAMCLLYERTGSLLPGIAVHSFIDASAFETALSGNNLVVAAVFLVLIIALLIGPTFRALRRTFSGGGRVATE